MEMDGEQDEKQGIDLGYLGMNGRTEYTRYCT